MQELNASQRISMKMALKRRKEKPSAGYLSGIETVSLMGFGLRSYEPLVFCSASNDVSSLSAP